MVQDYKQVHHNLSELEDIGGIEFDGGGSGRAKKSVLAYDGLEIDIPFPGSEDSAGTAAPREDWNARVERAPAGRRM